MHVIIDFDGLGVPFSLKCVFTCAYDVKKLEACIGMLVLMWGKGDVVSVLLWLEGGTKMCFHVVRVFGQLSISSWPPMQGHCSVQIFWYLEFMKTFMQWDVCVWHQNTFSGILAFLGMCMLHRCIWRKKIGANIRQLAIFWEFPQKKKKKSPDILKHSPNFLSFWIFLQIFSQF